MNDVILRVNNVEH